MKIRMSLSLNYKEGEKTVEPVIWSQLCTGLPDLQPKSPTKKYIKHSGYVGPTVLTGTGDHCIFFIFKSIKRHGVQKEVI